MNDAEIEKVAMALCTEVGVPGGCKFPACADTNTLCSEYGDLARAALTALSPTRDELIEALRPFVEAANCLDGDEPDRMEIWEHSAAMEIEARHLLKARAVLAKEADDG